MTVTTLGSYTSKQVDSESGGVSVSEFGSGVLQLGARHLDLSVSLASFHEGLSDTGCLCTTVTVPERGFEMRLMQQEQVQDRSLSFRVYPLFLGW